MKRLALALLLVTTVGAGAFLALHRPGAQAGPDSAMTASIDDLQEFLDTCPTLDPVYEQIRGDFDIRRNGVLVGDIPCSEPISGLRVSQYTDELIVLQGLRAIYYMDLGRSGHLPWTSSTLYEWMKSKIGGINLSDTAGGSYCCETYDDRLHIVVKVQDDFNRDFDRTWQGISGNIGLYMHETRHVDGFPHVSGCGIPNGCDQTYDETNLSPYGIQWWLEAHWLTGELYVGFSCLDSSDVQEIANWHLSGANSFRDRFVDTKPPELTMPENPGGLCIEPPTPSPTPTPTPSGATRTLVWAPGWHNETWTGASTPEEAFACAAGSYAAAYRFTDAGLERYFPGRPDISDMGPLAQYDAFLILVTQPVACTMPVAAASGATRILQWGAGWHNDAWSGADGMAPQQAFACADGSYAAAYRSTDAGLERYFPDRPDISDMGPLNKHDAFLILVTAPVACTMPVAP